MYKLKLNAGRDIFNLFYNLINFIIMCAVDKKSNIKESNNNLS